MQTPRLNYSKSILVILLLNLCCFISCKIEQTANQNAKKNSTQNTETDKSNRASDNIDELLNLVRLPVVPDDVVWQENVNANPKKLVAVLKFTPETLPGFLAIIEKNKQADLVDVGVESWFPEELTAQAQLSGEGMLKGTSYGATEFYNIPYGTGRISRIKGTDYFVLELTAAN
jgi:hypothetical protein